MSYIEKYENVSFFNITSSKIFLLKKDKVYSWIIVPINYM